MKLGISSYAFTWAIGVSGYEADNRQVRLSSEGLLRKAARLGVSVVQIADNLPLSGLSDRQLAELLLMARNLDISIEVGSRGLDELSGYLDLCNRFRSPLLRLVIDTDSHHPTEDEIIRKFKAYMPAFEQAGVILAVENHERFTAIQFRRIIEAVSSQNIGICLDTVNSFGALEGPDVVLNLLGPFVVNLHIKDFTIYRPAHNMGFIVAGRPAGQGKLDVPWLLDRLEGEGRNPNVILELWVPPEATVGQTIAKEQRWAEASILYLRDLIPDW